MANEIFDIAKKVKKDIKVKFNYALANPIYDWGLALKKAKEEKSFIAYEQQNHIDNHMTDASYRAGQIYDIPMELYDKFASKYVETYNPLFGSFQGEARKLVERQKIPFMILMDANGKYLNPMDEKLDLHANK